MFVLYIGLCLLPILTVALIAWWELRGNWIEKADEKWLDSIKFPIGGSGTLGPPQGVSAEIPLPNGYSPLVDPTPDAALQKPLPWHD